MFRKFNHLLNVCQCIWQPIFPLTAVTSKRIANPLKCWKREKSKPQMAKDCGQWRAVMWCALPNDVVYLAGILLTLNTARHGWIICKLLFEVEIKTKCRTLRMETKGINLVEKLLVFSLRKIESALWIPVACYLSILNESGDKKLRTIMPELVHRLYNNLFYNGDDVIGIFDINFIVIWSANFCIEIRC